jgi:two-component system chemotaxis response regulator CheY
MRVLIIDDARTMRMIVRSVLQTIGATAIEEAGDGKEGLEKAEAFKPDLVLVDWNMPVMDGLTFAKAFRARNAKTPMIMITTEAEKSRVVEAVQAGVNNYALKPFTPAGLSKIIETTMAKLGGKAAA